MKKKFFRIAIIVILSLLLSACENENSTENLKTKTPTEPVMTPGSVETTPLATPTEATKVTPTAEISSTPTPAAEISSTPTPVEDDPTPHIVWALHFSGSASEEVQEEIQKFIDEKGINCRIDFIRDAYYIGGQEYEQWVENQRSQNAAPDILSSCAWEYPGMDYKFVEKNFQPLNEYFETEEGQALKNNYAGVEWEKIAVKDVTYTIPRRLQYTDDGIYLYVNNQYTSYFDELFDGSYESIRRIWEVIPDKDAKLRFYTFSGATLAFLGYRNWYKADFNRFTQTYTNVLCQDDVKELLTMVYEDFANGKITVAWGNQGDPNEEEIPADVLAAFYAGQRGEKQGFTQYEVFPDQFHTSLGITYGILKDAPHKDLAWQVYCACYSDPRIASLLYWGYADEEKWNRWTEEMNTKSASPTTGFVPELSEEQWDELYKYDDAVTELFNKMYYEGSKQANPDYLYYLDQVSSKGTKYDNLCQTLNEQLDEWKKNK